MEAGQFDDCFVVLKLHVADGAGLLLSGLGLLLVFGFFVRRKIQFSEFAVSQSLVFFILSFPLINLKIIFQLLVVMVVVMVVAVMVMMMMHMLTMEIILI